MPEFYLSGLDDKKKTMHVFGTNNNLKQIACVVSYFHFISFHLDSLCTVATSTKEDCFFYSDIKIYNVFYI